MYILSGVPLGFGLLWVSSPTAWGRLRRLEAANPTFPQENWHAAHRRLLIMTSACEGLRMFGLAASAFAKSPRSAVRSSHAAGAGHVMSVAIYLHDLSGGGVERQSLIIAEEFRRDGADVILVLHRLGGQLLDQVPAGLQIFNLNSPRTLLDIPRLARFLWTEQPDILLSNLDLNNVAALLAKSLSFSRTKVVICQHNPISSSFVAGENWLYRCVPLFYRILSPLISRAVAVSGGVAEELAALARLPRDRILTINNPVVGPDFQSAAKKSSTIPGFMSLASRSSLPLAGWFRIRTMKR